MALRGNQNALRHGLYRVTANEPDVAIEVELQFTLRPGLDRLADLRLVETFALASIWIRRAHELIGRDGLTEHLGSFVSRQAPLVERLEQRLHERDRERLADQAKRASDPLAAYRHRPDHPKETE